MNSRFLTKTSCFLVLLTAASPWARATENPDLVPAQAAVQEKLDQRIDLGLRFTDSSGRETALGELILSGRPVILTPVYYSCPQLCGLTMTGLRGLIDKLDLKAGSDYSVLTVSFNPAEGPADAKEKQEVFVKQLKDKASGELGWHFLVGDQESIRKLMEQIGFNYISDQGQFIHSAMSVVLTPEGIISGYFYGVQPNEADLKFALIQAAKGRIGGVMDQVMMYCFRYDSKQGRYTLLTMNIARAVGTSVLVLLAGAIAYMLVREKKSRREET